ncbi:hypothetical protein NDU88_006051 [Pleurodeles waltl]|uniref:Uncharacterized protein n=1 Tax=Pleurodeles waltl TaxID=8319 RepID=A0AAV7L4E4_PLEWA|nr:hypothetical protein NDU88_006051 [Pleurodeles waltl]
MTGALATPGPRHCSLSRHRDILAMTSHALLSRTSQGHPRHDVTLMTGARATPGPRHCSLSRHRDILAMTSRTALSHVTETSSP